MAEVKNFTHESIPALTNISSHARPHDNYQDEPGHQYGRIERIDAIRIAITALASASVWFRVWEPFPHVSLIGIAAAIFGDIRSSRKRWKIFANAG